MSCIGEPLVGVIIPAFNSASTITRCIDSILSQTYAKISLIVVDDGSQDDTPYLLATYGSKITHLHKANEGPGSARNVGINALENECELVLFVDADDYLDPSYITNLVTAQTKGRYDIVCSSIGPGTKAFQTNYLRPIAIESEEYLKLLLRNDIWRGCNGKLFTRSIIKGAFFFYSHYSEDLYFNVCVCSNRPKVLLNYIDGYHYTADNEERLTNRNEHYHRFAVDHLLVLQSIHSIIAKEHSRIVLNEFYEILWSFLPDICLQQPLSDNNRLILRFAQQHLAQIELPLFKKISLLIAPQLTARYLKKRRRCRLLKQSNCSSLGHEGIHNEGQ